MRACTLAVLVLPPILLGGFALAACPPPTPSVDVADADISAADEEDEPKSQAVSAPETSAEEISIEAWGLELTVPSGARWSLDETIDRLEIATGYGESVVFWRRGTPPPANLKEASASWHGDAVGEDGVRDGFYYARRTWEARTGGSGSGGRQMHRLEQVSRVHAMTALDDTTTLECQGYLEFEVSGPGDPRMQRALEVCLSARPAE
jgi:hypothetical protein